jgi:hypothetical protein
MKALTDLMKQLDDVVERHQDKFLHSFVVFLSPDAPGAAPAEGGDTAESLVKEAAGREALNVRLQTRAEKLKNLVLAYYPADGPKGYKVNENAEVTVLFYKGFKVEANYAFKTGELQPENVKTILKTLEDKLARPKRFSGKSAAK